MDQKMDIKGLIKTFIDDFIGVCLNFIYSFCPLRKKIVASAYVGRKYGDNPQYILEKIHEMDPSVEIVWIKKRDYDYKVPEWIRCVTYENKVRVFYEYATAKVWLDSHHVNLRIKKRKNQLYLETWHGGLGIKKIEFDSPIVSKNAYNRRMIQHTADTADVFISNSDFLTRVYRSAFHYKGKVWKCGYPKTDVLLKENSVEIRTKVRDIIKISPNHKLLLYAPTFRDWIYEPKEIMARYNLDYKILYEALCKRFPGEWYILMRLHPNINNFKGIERPLNEHVIDVTSYPEMQELVIACDALITDYSSCLFDAAVLEKPCFIYATDFEEFKDKRGTYYHLDELPFPYARTNKEIVEEIVEYNEPYYRNKWHYFRDHEVKLYEPGNAAEKVAFVLKEFINGNSEPFRKINDQKEKNV